LERPESSFREEEETDDEDDIEEGQERRNVTKEWRTQSRVLLTPTQPVRMSIMRKHHACRNDFVSNVSYEASQTKYNYFLFTEIITYSNKNVSDEDNASSVLTSDYNRNLIT